MISSNVIDVILYKLGFEDYDYDTRVGDEDGDFLDVICAELDFKKVKFKAIQTKPFKEDIIDNGPDFLVCTLKSTYDGYNVVYNLRFLSGETGGTIILINTNKIEYAGDDGEIRSFPSFSMLSEFRRGLEVED